MNIQTTRQQTLSLVAGQTITAAYSSLHTFSCELNNGQALILTATGSDEEPAISLALVDANQLDKDIDVVCRVDWSWIEGSIIAQPTATDLAVRLPLDPAGPLTIAVNVWQGKPFLSFQPFRPAKQA